MPSVSVSRLSKSYNSIKALDDVSFDVPKGELFGIIGPDGAGKTTLFRLLTTLILPDGGSAVIEGLDVVKDYAAVRHIIGYMPGKFSLYQDLTVEENLNFFATVFNTTVKENYHLIEDIYKHIEPFKTRRAGKLSGGMKQKLALSCALIHKPKVLFLDEPTTGVDPVSRKEFWEMLLKLKSQGITIIVSTPYMDEARLCDRIALMQNGNFLRIDSPENIIASYPQKLWSVTSDNMHGLLNDLRSCPYVKSSFSFGASYHVTMEENMTVAILNEYLINKGYGNIDIREIEPTVEDCFMLMLKEEGQ
ncbi:ABC transporter ATP-binding protein [Bacteroides caecigallinarum]|uniref:ABC transporter ATP-binding protein n=1 Tax=Bacteroides caecigallinarum TaxID=1411144 RepID=UPI00195F1EE1|nr:ABC transporter ATP-binding protein [Bacteroides caecigallinarum]MBM6883497.1 ABC transporter ATP-binding protein [Bacteroides caecigallinarum]